MARFVLVRSDAGDGGWSLHAPRSTDEDITSGAAPPILSGTARQDLDGDWSRPNMKDYAAAAIKWSPDLYTLLEALQEFESLFSRYTDIENGLARYDIDIGKLPKFGGDAPASTFQVWNHLDPDRMLAVGELIEEWPVWSWDADRLLIGEEWSFAKWRIVDRNGLGVELDT